MQMEAMAIASALGPFVYALDTEAALHIADLISDDVHDKYSQNVGFASPSFVH
jgi:hypothetical protein